MEITARLYYLSMLIDNHHTIITFVVKLLMSSSDKSWVGTFTFNKQQILSIIQGSMITAWI